MDKQTRKRIDTRKQIIQDYIKEGKLNKYKEYWLPEGSGSLGAMATICALIELLEEVLKDKSKKL